MPPIIILLRNYTHAFISGVESGGHSYCCDFGKSLLSTTQGSNPNQVFIVKDLPIIVTTHCIRSSESDTVPRYRIVSIKRQP